MTSDTTTDRRECIEEAVKRAVPHCKHTTHGQRLCAGCAAAAAAREMDRLPDGTFPQDPVREAVLKWERAKLALREAQRAENAIDLDDRTMTCLKTERIASHRARAEEAVERAYIEIARTAVRTYGKGR